MNEGGFSSMSGLIASCNTDNIITSAKPVSKAMAEQEVHVALKINKLNRNCDINWTMIRCFHTTLQYAK